MFLIVLKSAEGSQVVFALTGDVRSVHLPRLEQLVLEWRRHGRRACFDMEGVSSIEAGVILFFVEGAGQEAPLISPPEPLRSFRAV